MSLKAKAASAAPAMLQGAWSYGDQMGAHIANGRYGAARQMADRMLTVVVVGIVIITGILVYGEVNSALPSPSDSNLSNAQSNATGTFSDAMELAPVVLIVVVASLILAVVRRF